MKLNDLQDLVIDLTPRPRVAREGWSRTAGYLVGGGLSSLIGQRLKKSAGNRKLGSLFSLGGRLLLGFSLFSGFSYRDPERDPLGSDPHFIYAPADGKIVEIARNVAEPKFIGGPACRITIATNLLEVHIQRSPIRGQVHYLFKEHGTSKANYLGLISSGTGSEHRVLVVQQINQASLFRLPKPLAENSSGSQQVWVGNKLELAQQIGLAGFGQATLVSLYLPESPALDLVCKTGQHSEAGTTVVGRFKSF
ncbi:MAG: phosphatidylserine decarboxylase [Chloroflexota bacterium]